jgi:hypothetical protein
MLKWDPKGMRHADNRGQSKILSASLQVPQKRTMHLAVIRKFFLGAKPFCDSDFPDASSEAAQNIFHVPESL